MRTIPTTIYLYASDFELIKSVSPNAVYFFKKCQVLFEQTTMPFVSVAIIFTPDRFTRRPMCTMLKDLVNYVADDNVNRKLVCALINKFLFYLE